jgi:hypothetical protein
VANRNPSPSFPSTDMGHCKMAATKKTVVGTSMPNTIRICYQMVFGHICAKTCLSKTLAINLRKLEKGGIYYRGEHVMRSTQSRMPADDQRPRACRVNPISIAMDEKMVIKAIGLVVCHNLNEHFIHLHTEVVSELVFSF